MDTTIATVRARVVTEKNKTASPERTHSAMTRKDLITRSNRDSGQQPSNKQRRNLAYPVNPYTHYI